jgi:AcrR family transcriptional regulator
MGIAERREREREEVRRKILDAARDLFAREGYERVTMRAVADVIEYSPTAIYHHFEDKDDLVQALCEEDFARLLQTLSAKALPADPLARIRALGEAYAAFGLAHPNHYRFMFMTGSKFEKPTEVAPPGQQSFVLLRDAVQDALAAGQLQGRDALAVAQVLWATLHGAVSLLITIPPQCWPVAPASADLVAQVMDATLFGLLAPGVAAPRAAAAPVKKTTRIRRK